MIQAWVSRWLAVICLIGLFGGDGVALVDADLYHSGAVSHAPDRDHVESTGNPACHAEHCALGIVAARPHFTGPLLSSASLITLASRQSGFARRVAPPVSKPASNQLSRAPPLV